MLGHFTVHGEKSAARVQDGTGPWQLVVPFAYTAPDWFDISFYYDGEHPLDIHEVSWERMP
jgi:hypothetical protein